MKSEQQRLEFAILGMDCVEEVSILKREIGPLVGGDQNLSFDILKARMTLLAGPSTVDPSEIIRAVARTGMKAQPWKENQDGSTGSPASRTSRTRTILTVASGLFLMAGFLLHLRMAGGLSELIGAEGLGEAHGVPLLVRLLYLIAIFAAGWSIAPKAWFALRRGRPDMNLLMTVAVAGAIGIGEWFEAATVAFLFTVSLTLESWSVGRARRAVEALMELAAPVVRILGARGVEETPPEKVGVGSRFLVNPGERIPLDGRVSKGSSQVDQAPITGESLPVLKEPGDDLFAGTINGDGALEVESTKTSDDTTLAHIIRMVSEAQSRRAPSEQWVEKFARFYTPALIALAAAVLLVPPLLLSAPWAEWIYRSLVLLVIGCPCALVISTPVSIVAALASSARNGVLVKGGVFMEAPSRLTAIAFDKTGTLTEGKPSVEKVVALNGHVESEVLQRAAALESRSNHPLARAIVQHAEALGLEIQTAERFQILQGKGGTARIDGKDYWLGSHRYLEERGQETEEVHRHLEALSRAGRTVVVIGNDTHVCGFIALADSVRPEAPGVVQKLRRAGMKRIVMLTGDNEGTARTIGALTGVDEVQAELLPADKVRAVEKLVAGYGQVAMVGDGVNDAPAMGRASLGIAMGAAGSDAAIEAADIALMSDDLDKVPWLIQHSRRTLAIIRQNITLSIAIKVLFVALTFLGYASLWAAIAADMGVSLLVIFNALRLLGR